MACNWNSFNIWAMVLRTWLVGVVCNVSINEKVLYGIDGELQGDGVTNWKGKREWMNMCWRRDIYAVKRERDTDWKWRDGRKVWKKRKWLMRRWRRRGEPSIQIVCGGGGWNSWQIWDRTSSNSSSKLLTLLTYAASQKYKYFILRKVQRT